MRQARSTQPCAVFLTSRRGSPAIFRICWHEFRHRCDLAAVVHLCDGETEEYATVPAVFNHNQFEERGRGRRRIREGWLWLQR